MKAAATRVKFLVLHSRKQPNEIIYIAPHLFEAYRIEEAEKREQKRARPSEVFEALVVRAFNIDGVWVKPRNEPEAA